MTEEVLPPSEAVGFPDTGIKGQQPLVSVLTPSFNQGRWLMDNLRSVDGQAYQRLEHIVMDGGSTDGSIDLLANYQTERLRWWTEPDRGQSHALNKALRRSSGSIIGWLNSDDAYFSSASVRLAVETFERHPEAIVVYGHAVTINATGLILQAQWVPKHNAALIRMYDYIAQPAAFIRRSAIEGMFLDESYHYIMDAELWTRLANIGDFRRIDRILAIDRHHLKRKSAAGARPAANETARLSHQYGVRIEGQNSPRRRLRRLIFRLRAVRLLPEARTAAVLFNRRADSPFRTLLRQLCLPRRAMPSE